MRTQVESTDIAHDVFGQIKMTVVQQLAYAQFQKKGLQTKNDKWQFAVVRGWVHQLRLDQITKDWQPLNWADGSGASIFQHTETDCL